MVEAQLNSEEVGPTSFVALVNSALIFRLDTNHAELAAEALKLGRHRLANIEALGCPEWIGKGCGGGKRAGACGRASNPCTQIQPRYRICLVHRRVSMDLPLAATSRADINEWREYVGDWLTEFAFDDFQESEGQTLYSRLHCLCHAVPELWVSCGRARAALAAFNAL